jgi:hypothetical protein
MREEKSYTCPAGHVPGSPQCLVTTRSREVPIVRTSASATYAGRELTLAELDVLVKPSLRREWHAGIEDPVRQRQVLEQSLGHIDNQLALLRHRRDEIEALCGELETRRRRVRDRLRAIGRRAGGRATAG